MGIGCAVRNPRVTQPKVVRTFPDESPEIYDRKNLELYYLFWLDRTSRSPEFIETQNELRSIIDYVRIFESSKECQREFETITNGKIFFIVNSIEGLPLLPSIHNHKHLHSIYMYYNGNNNDIASITNQYKKIRGVYDSFVMAKRYLEDDIKVHTDIDDPMIIDIFNDDNDREYREKFTLFVKTVNVNAEDIHDRQTRTRLIKMCMKYYQDNVKEIDLIEEFSHLYKSEQAMSWYMREFCLHRLLSRAFIEHDMSLLVDMYSFVVDINRDLQKKSIKSLSPLRVFRGQFISNEKLSLLKKNIGQMITMQCFFSAQTSRNDTVNVLQNIEPNDTSLKHILFEIDVLQDYTLFDNDESPTSKTVLFRLGAIFTIVEVNETTIQLSQCISHLNDNYDLANESRLIIQGILTYLKDGTNEAIKYFENLLHDSSKTNPSIYSSIYGQLGYLQQKSGNLSRATQMYKQSIDNGTMQFGLLLFYIDQAAQYHATVLNDWEKAKTLWIQKLNIEDAFLSKENKAQTYENLARAAYETKQYDKTVEYTLAAIECLPHDHQHLSFLQQQLEYARKNLSE